MDERINRKLNILYFLWFATLILFCVVFVTLKRPVSSNTVVTQQGQPGMQGRIGDPGLNGKDGRDGVSFIGPRGLQGANGASSIQMLQPTVVQGTPGAQGEKGDKGDPGTPGENGQTPEVRVENCQFQYKYPYDDEWTPKGNVCEAPNE